MRRIYHAAGRRAPARTSDYDVNPQDVVAAAGAALALIDEERGHLRAAAAFDLLPPASGAGRGGLPTRTSATALWTALAAGAGPGREIHLVVRRARQADEVAEAVGGVSVPPPCGTEPPEQMQRGHRCG
ncbi:hypothetical protein [Streptomyces clavuligerus]|uniref:hypothetical protein n=1 Tax=Streptomyces clavuligerus TaxID=1901 RepID=UPI001F07DCD5|nr:hypothetical protein [Streptomyces clavuligerus]